MFYGCVVTVWQTFPKATWGLRGGGREAKSIRIDLKKKVAMSETKQVEQILEICRVSKEEAIDALVACNDDLELAIDRLLAGEARKILIGFKSNIFRF